MARIKLINQLKLEIEKYLGLPYFTNKPPIKTENNALVGKGDSKEIALTTIELANKLNINLLDLSPIEIYRFQKKHGIGIDCSGLIYHLSNFYYYLKTGKDIKSKLIGTEGKRGPRRLSANLLTNHPNAKEIKNLQDIQTADLIRMDQGKHVIFIIENLNNTIYYVHSSEKTKQKGVHYGQIKIVNPDKSLKYQQWSDKTIENKKYSSLFNPKLGDGIFRLNCLS